MSYWWSYLFVWTIPISQLSCKLRWWQTIPRSKPNLTQRPSQLVSRITEGNSIFLFSPYKMLLRDFPANRNVARHWSLRDKSKKLSSVAYLAMELMNVWVSHGTRGKDLLPSFFGPCRPTPLCSTCICINMYKWMRKDHNIYHRCSSQTKEDSDLALR